MALQNTNDGNVRSLRGKDISKQGDTIGVDQLISAQPVLVSQEKVIITRARIWAATVFIDYVKGYVHVGMMQYKSGEATLQDKHDFEHLSSTRDVNIKHYHAENGQFFERLFTDDVKSSSQRIIFCGVGAHHQNGITERVIKELTLTSQTLLVHAQNNWPEYILTMLWQFSLKAAQDCINQLKVNL